MANNPEDGYVEWNADRGVYEQFDEDGVFMHTVSFAEGLLSEDQEEYDQFAEMHDAGMSLRDFR
jgi:hypothetical protein|tara:strand:+ start:1233 stop:1424 length:192 start_codon:yes stop_codon:yes gene_type:complete